MTTATEALPESPFQSSDPRFDYWSAAHRLAFEQLQFVLQSGLFLSVFTGDVGAGKSTVLRQAVALAQSRTLIGVVRHGPMLSTTPARAVLAAFGADPGPGAADVHAALLRRSLRAAVADGRADGGAGTLVIDDAHRLGGGALQALLDLSGIGAGEAPLFRLVLAGPPEVTSRLWADLPGLMGPTVHLDAMSPEDTSGFVRHRMSVAGVRALRFDDTALATVHDITGGNPLRINLLCMFCLDEAWDRDVEVIDAALVRECNVAPETVLDPLMPEDTGQRPSPTRPEASDRHGGQKPVAVGRGGRPAPRRNRRTVRPARSRSRPRRAEARSRGRSA
jgi:general secretion pathway protein A